jgi:cysteine sulfinate desulfinase/cysteine desulfurase-like protein
MGVPEAEANALMRFSLGRTTTLEEVEEVLQVIPGVIRRIRGE